jgi:hypothetical protein
MTAGNPCLEQPFTQRRLGVVLVVSGVAQFDRHDNPPAVR